MPLKGYIASEQHRQNLSDALKGRKVWNKGKKCLWVKDNPQIFKKGHIPWNKELKGSIIGKKNGRWKGGISKNKYYNRLCLIKRRNKTKFGSLTIAVIQEVYQENIKYYGTLTCYLCLKPIEFGQDCLEHKIPLSRSGTNQKENLAIAHRSCNAKKYNKTEEEYMKGGIPLQ